MTEFRKHVLPMLSKPVKPGRSRAADAVAAGSGGDDGGAGSGMARGSGDGGRIDWRTEGHVRLDEGHVRSHAGQTSRDAQTQVTPAITVCHRPSMLALIAHCASLMSCASLLSSLMRPGPGPPRSNAYLGRDIGPVSSAGRIRSSGALGKS